MLILTIISVVTAVAVAIHNIFLSKKNRRLEQEKFEYDRKKDAKAEFKDELQVLKKQQAKKTDSQIYAEHITRKFQYLDFTGLNAILQKPLLLEKIYVSL
ncbi:MAG: hypothetical protein GY757_53955 [bacterium]|nr:hypothetical protein [bacterium]